MLPNTNRIAQSDNKIQRRKVAASVGKWWAENKNFDTCTFWGGTISLPWNIFLKIKWQFCRVEPQQQSCQVRTGSHHALTRYRTEPRSCRTRLLWPHRQIFKVQYLLLWSRQPPEPGLARTLPRLSRPSLLPAKIRNPPSRSSVSSSSRPGRRCSRGRPRHRYRAVHRKRAKYGPTFTPSQINYGNILSFLSHVSQSRT